MALASTPNATDKIKDTQAPIKNNFDLIQAAFVVNHVDFGASGAGKHKFLQFPAVQVSAPTTAGAGEVALYSVTGGTSALPEIAWRKPSNGSSIVFTEGAQTAQGYTRLPSGILIKWGNQTVNGSGTHTWAANPVFSTVYQVLATVADVSSAVGSTTMYVVNISAFTTTGYTAKITDLTGAAVNKVISYIAIGLG